MANYRRAAYCLLLLGIFLVSCAPAAPEVAGPPPVFDPEQLIPFSDGSLPGSEPEPFGSGWFQGGFHSSPVFSPDGLSMWWAGSYATQKVYASRYEDGNWTEQEAVSFSEDIPFYRDPFISPDGLKFYFISTASLPDTEGSGKENLWMMDWESGSWSVPRPLAASVNSFQLHWTPSVAENYDLYFAANVDGNPDIFKAEYVEGSYHHPVSLGSQINSADLEFTPHIAPDQSYLLFSRAKDGDSPPRLFISYSREGEWTEPVRVENVANCISPILTPDQEYMIYLTGPSGLAWRDTSFVEELRPE